MKCGSPGFIAPEVLNDKGYDTKADIFSAGIILCILLTGVSPFYDKNHDNVLLKNKRGVIDFTEPHWAFISSEAKSLVRKIVAKDPQERCTAAEALNDPWFYLELTDTLTLSSAQENIRKYHNQNRFNVTKIKPEFTMIAYTPLLNPRCVEKNSPLLIPANDNKIMPMTQNINGLSENSSVDDTANFEEKEMDERKGNTLTSRLPVILGFKEGKSLSHLKHWTTPFQNCRALNISTKMHNKESYFGKLSYPIFKGAAHKPCVQNENERKIEQEIQSVAVVKESLQEFISENSNTNREEEDWEKFVTVKSCSSSIVNNELLGESENRASVVLYPSIENTLAAKLIKNSS